jgi:hypothetical protein
MNFLREITVTMAMLLPRLRDESLVEFADTCRSGRDFRPWQNQSADRSAWEFLPAAPPPT